MSQIVKWRKQVERFHAKFLNSNNIHDYISWKKYCWLIEGYNQGLEDGKNGDELMADQH